MSELHSDGVLCTNTEPELCILERITPKKTECIIYDCPPRRKNICNDSDTVGNAVKDTITASIKDVIYPKPLTIFEQCLEEAAECRYHRSKYPLERRLLNPLYAPYCLDTCNTTFGKSTKTDEAAKEIINPSKSAHLVAEEALICHDLYKFSHQDYFPGEFVSRNYCRPSYNPFKRFGRKTISDLEGKKTKILMQPELNNDPLCFTSHTLNRYLEKSSSELGKPKNPLKDSSCLSLGHVNGKPTSQDEYTLGDLMHYRDECRPIVKSDLRSKLAKLRSHLKAAIWTNFENAKQAFEFFDKKKLGYIDAGSLREVLLQFNIRLTDEEISGLIMDCKQSNFGEEDEARCCGCCCGDTIGLYERHRLKPARTERKQWKVPCTCGDEMKSAGNNSVRSTCETAKCNDNDFKKDAPSNQSCSRQFCNRYVPECACSCKGNCAQKSGEVECPAMDKKGSEVRSSEVINYHEFVNFLTIFPYTSDSKDLCGVFRLVKQVGKRGSSHLRTSQEVNSVYGEVDLNKIPTFGKMSEIKNSLLENVGGSKDITKLYKSLDNVKQIINPSPLLGFGLNDDDLKRPRTKEQIRQIFCLDVERMEKCEFDDLFDKASLGSGCCMASVEKFKEILDLKLANKCLNLIDNLG